MTDQEIIKALRYYAYRYRQPPYGREIEGTDGLLDDAADRLEELTASQHVMKMREDA